MKNVFYLIFSILLLFSCGTKKNMTGANNTDQSEIQQKDINLDLTAQLRRLPGVLVSGEGQNAKFKIRGASSVSAGQGPLFILDGQAMQSYSALYPMVPPANFKSAKVLKNSSETSIYGARGANGVIVISTKKE